MGQGRAGVDNAAAVKQAEEDEDEETLAHSRCGATHAALKGVVGTLKARAGELFAAGQDEVAVEVRRLAQVFGQQLSEVQVELDVHIRRSMDAAARRRSGR